jgi:hypothetical protein
VRTLNISAGVAEALLSSRPTESLPQIEPASFEFGIRVPKDQAGWVRPHARTNEATAGTILVKTVYDAGVRT